MMGVKCISAPDGGEFYYPDGEYLDQFIIEVLNGKEYPLLYGELAEVDVVVDVGAHVGAALRYFSGYFPDARYLAYEPNPKVFQILRRNMEFVGGLSLELRGVALGSSDDEMKLYMGKYSSMQASLLPNEENSQESFCVPVRNAGQEMDVLCGGHFDLLKLDTEGMELSILESLGARVLVVKYVLLEYHSDSDRLKVEQFLQATHSLYFSSVFEPDRGTLCYIAKSYLQELRATHNIKHYAYPKYTELGGV